MTLNIFNGKKKQQQFIDKLNKCITIIGYDMMPRKICHFSCLHQFQPIVYFDVD